MKAINDLISLLKEKDYIVKTTFLVDKKLDLNEKVLSLYELKLPAGIELKHVIVPYGTKLAKEIKKDNEEKYWRIIEMRAKTAGYLTETENDCFVLTTDLLFDSMSDAVSFVLGYSSDGYDVDLLKIKNAKLFESVTVL